MRRLLLLALALAAPPEARSAEFSLAFRAPDEAPAAVAASRSSCEPRASVVGSGAALTRVEVVCNADGSSTATYSAFAVPGSSIDAVRPTRQLQTLEKDRGIVRTKDDRGSCTVGGDESCSAFQRCEPAAAAGIERVCKDFCDPRRCRDGLTCRLEPRQSCGLEVAACPPVAVCVELDGT